MKQRILALLLAAGLCLGLIAAAPALAFSDVSGEELSEAVAADVPSYAALKPIHPSMAGEDFVEFSGCGARLVFAFIGSNGEPGCADWHSPHFVGVDGAIGPAVDFYVNASLRVLAELR